MGAFNLKPSGYERFMRCNIANFPASEQTYIPLKQWATENNYTTYQVKNLLKTGFLAGFRYKNRYYVMEIEQKDG